MKHLKTFESFSNDIVEEGLGDFFKKSVSPEEKEKAMSAKYDSTAKAWVDGLVKKNPKLNVELYNKEIANSKASAVAGAIKRSKEMGAKEGNFKFQISKGKLIVSYEQGNLIPSTGLGGATDLGV